jgi:hypothetical protein
MTTTQAILYSLLNLIFIAAGLGLAITQGWSHSGPNFYGIVAFVLSSLCLLALSVSLTRIFISTKPGFSYTMLFNGNQYSEFKKAVGKRTARFINTFYLTLFFLLFSGTAYVYAKARQRYEQHHLANYGKIVKVGIKANEWAGNGRQYGLFDHTLNEKTYHYKLQTSLYKGDSDLVIISQRNPEIIKWLDAYTRESKNH